MGEFWVGLLFFDFKRGGAIMGKTQQLLWEETVVYYQ